jgi:hypothetical protein
MIILKWVEKGNIKKKNLMEKYKILFHVETHMNIIRCQYKDKCEYNYIKYNAIYTVIYKTIIVNLLIYKKVKQNEAIFHSTKSN